MTGEPNSPCCELCVALFYTGTKILCLNDIYCSQSFNFICQKQAV